MLWEHLLIILIDSKMRKDEPRFPKSQIFSLTKEMRKEEWSLGSLLVNCPIVTF